MKIIKVMKLDVELWIYNRFLIFCELDDKIPKGQYLFKFNEKFNYSKYEIDLTSSNEFNITKIDSNKVDIYSSNQTINVVDNKEIYELKFKIKSYNQELLFLNFAISLEPLDCKRENDELICLIKKSLLECYSDTGSLKGDMNLIDFERAKQQMSLIYFNEQGKEEYLYLIGNFILNFNVQKVDVYVKITKLLTNNLETDNFITYETNVTEFPSVIGGVFHLNFTGKEEHSLNFDCILKKGEYNPLLLFCIKKYEGILSLKEIENEIRLNNINSKYNFIIQPVKNNENITIINTKNRLPIISSIYPNILNFTKKNTFEIILYLQGERSTPLEGITFNEKEKDLECKNLGYKIICNVSKEHFKGINNKYYYLKYYNPNVNNKVTSFLATPIKIILPKTEPKSNNNNDNKLILIISIIASVIVFIIIVFVVIICIYKNKKSDLKEEVLKTSFQDTENEENEE